MSSGIGAFKLGINLMLLDNFTNKFGNVETKLGKIDKWANNFGNKISSVMTPMNAVFVGLGWLKCNGFKPIVVWFYGVAE